MCVKASFDSRVSSETLKPLPPLSQGKDEFGAPPFTGELSAQLTEGAL